MSHEFLLSAEDSVLVVVDLQEKLLPVMTAAAAVEARAGLLIEAAGRMDIPVLYSEQYPRGLGPTIDSLARRLGSARRFEKHTFSCTGHDPFLDAVEDLGREQILLCGIETHVCVLQTALGLLANGLQVHVAADAVTSRRAIDHERALARMAQTGVVISGMESALFEWMEEAGTETFKALAPRIRDLPAD